MSRQSKAAKNKILAAKFTAVRLAGGTTKAPSRLHTKEWTRRVDNRFSEAYARATNRPVSKGAVAA